MVQGTTSDAGKTVLVAGLGRVLQRRGLSVAPFKPQNMALNSAVSIDGGEIGRAQYLQAQACCIDPHSDMNPVLLKPESDCGAQVIIQGKVFAALNARQYHDYKSTAMRAVLQSYARLQQRFNYLLIEGAGSPAEINLRDRDIANMGFAEEVDCPVIIVADIDRGGVFAHLVGTLDLLSETEQARVIGFVINRFRGDISLLQPGIDWLQERTGKPVLATLPYLQQFYLDAEDAVYTGQTLNTEQRLLKVAVPVFARISNHTDFDMLRLHPQVDLRFVPPGQALDNADLIILPGSKNVRADITALRKHGWHTDIERHLRYGGKLIGICGGFQMLGRELNDPNGVEGIPGSEQGLALLDMSSELKPSKQLRNVSGYLQLDAAIVKGYEIHCGVTQGPALTSPLLTIDGKPEGVLSQDGQIAGTYLHGVFDEPEACLALLKWSGLDGHAESVVPLAEQREIQLERLADCIEENFDITTLIESMHVWGSDAA